MDESSLCLHQANRRGIIAISKKALREDAVQRVSLSRRRKCFTLVAFICDQPAIQLLLPQVLIVSAATCAEKVWREIQSTGWDNMIIVRQKSAWNNERLCAVIIRRLGSILAKFTLQYRPFLFMDSVRFHTSPQVLTACKAMMITPIIIPPLLTWLLQPLDTGAFSLFKHILRELYQGARAQSETDDIDLQNFMACISQAIAGGLNARNWGAEFDRCGFGQQQRYVRASAWRKFDIGQCEAPTWPPSYEQIRLCLPRKTQANLTNLWRMVGEDFGMGNVCTRAIAAPSIGLASGRITVRSEIGRTRSQTRALTSYPRGQPLPGRRILH